MHMKLLKKLSKAIRILKWGDFVLLILLLSTAALSLSHLYSSNQGKLQVEILQKNKKFYYPLDENREIDLFDEHKNQVMKILIADDQIWVAESNCSRQLCVLRGPISEANQWIACLPNQVFIRLQGDGPADNSKKGISIDAEVF